MDQRSGRPAQRKFSWLCSEASLTCNGSEEDDHGWDFIVEIPAPSTHDLPADKVPAPKQVLVQVKSTKGRSATTRLKVSNALKFAKAELPCFVILFHECSDGRRRIYARHFWEELIESALKRGREVSAAHKLPHKTTMNISFSDRDEHSGDLIAWMRDTVNALPKEYGSEKQMLYETLGYAGERNYRAEVIFGPLEGVEELVDHQLGLTDSLPVLHIKLIDSRFGIDAPSPILESTSGELKLRPDPREGNVVLQASNGDIISLPATARSPAIPGLPPEKLKLSIETWLFTAILSRDEITWQINNLMDRKLPIERLVDLVSFFSWNGPISAKFVAADGPPLDFFLNLSVTGKKGDWLKLANSVKTLRKIQSRAGVATVELALRDLQNSWSELSVFHDILTAEDMRLGIVQDSTWEPEICSRMLGYFDFEVGGLTFLVVFDALITEQSAQEDRILLVLGERVCLDCFVGEEADSIRSLGQASYERQADRHDEDCVALGNFRDFFRK